MNTPPSRAYAAPTQLPDFGGMPPAAPPVVNKALPPPLPPKPTDPGFHLPPKPKDMHSMISDMNTTYIVQNYEFMNNPDIKLHQKVRCDAPDMSGYMQSVIIPVPNIPLPVIDPEKAHVSFVNYVNSKCCWDHSLVENLHVESHEMSYCYKITLDNFLEERYASWEEASLDSSSISPPNMGVPPMPWSIDFKRTTFTESEQSVPLPFTDIVKACHDCAGSGRMLCEACKGRGSVPCPHCTHQPENPNQPMNAPLTCTECQGNGFVFCKPCQGLGTLSCASCGGSGRMKQYLQLTSKTENYTMTRVMENGGLTKAYLELLDGTPLFHVMGNRLVEGAQSNDEYVNNAVRELLAEAQEMERTHDTILWQQQLTVSVIPVCTLHYQVGEDRFFASVFDEDLKVFCPDYPVQKMSFFKNVFKCTVM